MKRGVRSVTTAGMQGADMPIYTKTGDQGETAVWGNKRMKKNHPIIEANGAIDEFTSMIGVVITEIPDLSPTLTKVQKDLYEIMAYLAQSPISLQSLNKRTGEMEREIDELEKTLPALSSFILPQGTKESSWLNLLRSTCRRAERNVVAVEESYVKIDISVLSYLNRLSDYLYMLSRKYNSKEEIKITKLKK